MDATLTPGYVVARVSGANGTYRIDMPEAKFESVEGVFTIAVVNATSDRIVASVRITDSDVAGPPVHFIQPAVPGSNSSLLEIEAGQTVAFVLSGGVIGQPEQTCSFSLSVAPAPVMMAQRSGNQIDPWH